ncbi:hypothetical protein GAP32_363 [Cronobacter phage vB_CsaM_GAP32]|uniref:Uncharacterized protein n=1 Tax=Cronobacter phage vB_CsaM_GAP32 TaxID=1141136 RepID=K4F717_9CAUD|nr:hypothetical protein GAP32_363 [Cronobacter phage vB_CsaM_GAP32]AFC21813.1 hypothetical protein GAP32_363 [Cronobacter phage vB_CsaM_GAP32]
MTIAEVRPWVQPSPFKIDGSVLPCDIRDDLVEYCLDTENMYDYCDGDFTAVFDLTKPLFLEDLTETEPDDEVIDYVAVIKQHLPDDYKETTIGVYFCNG